MARMVLIGAIVVAAVALRAHALFTDFWLDEIWSLRIAQEAPSVAAVFTTAHDNNHPLNTLAMFLMGPQENFVLYRLPALICGLLTIFILARATTDPFERLVVVLLSSLSLPMVVYSTEARGYAMAAMLVSLAWLLRQRPWVSAICLGVALFAHLTSVYVWAALLVSDARSAHAETRRRLLPHVIPAAAAAWCWFAFIQKIHIGGGPRIAKVSAAIEALAWSVGANGTIAAVIAVVLIVLAIRKSDDPLFFTVAIFAVPAVTLIRHRGEYLSGRYFFVLLPFVFLLFARLAATIPRPAAVGALAVWVVATSVQLVPFLQYGRGSYREALALIGSGDVSGDNDFRNGTLIDFYAPGSVRMHPEGSPMYARTPWFLLASFDREPKIRPVIRTFAAEYRLAGVFRYGGVSGWHWLVYRRVAGGQ